MGLRLSMLHRHSPKSDRLVGEAASPFTEGQGAASAQYEAAMQGPFPVYSVTEDYALSLELKKAGIRVSHTQNEVAS
jgi:cellulose synthase/poly-beta-1,6-N-acetylglucosamine synthase-like glycosyltransferase